MKRILLAVGIATSLATLPAAAFAAGTVEHPMSCTSCKCHSQAQDADARPAPAVTRPEAARKTSSNFTPAELTQIWTSP